MSDTQEKLHRALMTGPNRWAEATINGKLVSYYEVHDVDILLALIESAKREGAIEELEAINAASDKNHYFTCDEYDSYIQDRLAQLKKKEISNGTK